MLIKATGFCSTYHVSCSHLSHTAGNKWFHRKNESFKFHIFNQMAIFINSNKLNQRQRLLKYTSVISDTDSITHSLGLDELFDFTQKMTKTLGAGPIQSTDFHVIPLIKYQSSKANSPADPKLCRQLVLDHECTMRRFHRFQSASHQSQLCCQSAPAAVRLTLSRGGKSQQSQFDS